MTAVPVELRSTVAAELGRLVRGELTELLVWLTSYPAVVGNVASAG